MWKWPQLESFSSCLFCIFGYSKTPTATANSSFLISESTFCTCPLTLITIINIYINSTSDVINRPIGRNMGCNAGSLLQFIQIGATLNTTNYLDITVWNEAHVVFKCKILPLALIQHNYNQPIFLFFFFRNIFILFLCLLYTLSSKRI